MNCSSEKSRCWTRCLGIALLAIAGIAALGGAVMLLWNALIPDLFAGARPLGYGQALGLLLLCRILFGGWRGGCHGRWKGSHQRGEGMTADERDRLKGRFASRWGTCGGSAKTSGGDPGASDTPPAQVG